MPDTQSDQIMPIAPQMALATPTPGGLITLVAINRVLMATSQRYFFAHDITNCPR